jgi:thymidine kinase
MAENSYLKLYIGPMFSGKSTHLLTEINKYKHITSNIIVINHILDKKRHLELEKSDGYLKTHDNKIFPAIMLNNLSEIYINESFFKI